MTDAQRRSKARIAYQKAKRKKQLHNRIFITILIAVVIFIAIGAIIRIRQNHAKTTYVKADQITDTLYNDNRPELDVDLLPVNDYSRPARALEKVNCGSLYGKPGNDGATEQGLFCGIGGVSYYSCKQSFCDWAGGRNRTVYSVR